MLKRFLIPLFIVALLAAPTAQALTDRDHLLKWCPRDSSVAAGRCIGYLLAAEDALAEDSIEGIRACLPQDISLQQQHKVVVEWLKANPQVESATALGSWLVPTLRTTLAASND